ncbi:MAG: nucleoside-diphosphate kinase [Thermoanaerobaculia bacterium]
MSQRTLTIIKPDAVEAGNAEKILAQLEAEGFNILALKRLQLDRDQARSFYRVHRQRPFYDSLVEFMTSGPVVVAALEREDAVAGLRRVMGATNPQEAAEGTLRALYASSIERNAIHGSDSLENAALELAFFFSPAELAEPPAIED